MNLSINCIVNVPEEIYKSRQNRGLYMCMLRLIFKYTNKKIAFSLICKIVVSFYPHFLLCHKYKNVIMPPNESPSWARSTERSSEYNPGCECKT